MSICHSAAHPYDLDRLQECLSQFSLRTRALLHHHLPNLLLAEASDPKPLSQLSPATLPLARSKYRVTLLLDISLEATAQVFVKDVTASCEEAAMAMAVHLLWKDCPPARFGKISRQQIEKLR